MSAASPSPASSNTTQPPSSATAPPPQQPSAAPLSAPPPAVPSPTPTSPVPRASTPSPPPVAPTLTPPTRPPPPPPQSPVPPRTSPPPDNSPPPPTVTPPRRSPPPPPKNSSQTPPPRPQPPSSPPPSLQPTPPRPSPAPPVQPPSSSPSPVQPAPPRSSPPPSSLLSPPPTSSTPPPATSITQPPPPPPSNSTTPRLSPPTPASIIQLSPPPPPLQNGSENSSPQSGGISSGAILAIAVFGGILFLGFIGVAIWCFRRQRKKDSSNHGYVMPSTLPSSSTESDSSFFKIHAASTPLVSSDVVHTPSDPGGGMGHSRNWFSYEELIKATNGFSTLNLLGEGGFGSVYKGILPDGREIAVKQLKIGGSQGEREFKAEVDIISRIHHRHLVSLVGYCIQDNRKILVYDYVPNNTLYFHLHENGQPVLEWEKRVKIAAGAARGIAYLHEDCNPRIIHRDIKPSNILLDYNYEARVSDFGLAKLAQDANTHVSTRVMGTFGYVAPEYASSGKLTDKSDVYSFGVVLLELITGRMPVDPSQMGDESLVEWARPLLSDALETGEFESLIDPKLGKNYIDSEMFCMIEVAAACVRHSASKRPRMGQVVRAFESLATSDLTNGMRVGESQAFDSAQQSEEIRLFRRMAFGSQNYSSEYFNHSSLRL
ncbi:putative protein kinase RLK-Pelle-PERK-1 family [Medicago truncatula]|uniref:non-specific serine/threonine protein kinase n=1 Tax=Medicago truncatula TaxID=3880 RepID=A0A072TGW2_MEDTR|nr:proline-rich receptor-like protein kinase PERK9 [Medicago truncatula]KEH16411.1 tyrosine kinase family protein [Medicago truncatula]RHN38528.1 putative protein kinase RLK-Pelle-PERK-1 family [Medicago truncatula]